MRGRSSIWWGIGILAMMGYLLFGRGFHPGQLVRVAQEKHRLEAAIDRLSAEVESLRTELVRLREDTLLLERLARERLGMKRPGEIIYRFIPPLSRDTTSDDGG